MKLLFLIIISSVIITKPRIKKNNISDDGEEYEIAFSVSILGKVFTLTLHRRLKQ
jgi:hypothetical protein